MMTDQILQTLQIRREMLRCVTWGLNEIKLTSESHTIMIPQWEFQGISTYSEACFSSRCTVNHTHAAG